MKNETSKDYKEENKFCEGEYKNEEGVPKIVFKYNFSIQSAQRVNVGFTFLL